MSPTLLDAENLVVLVRTSPEEFTWRQIIWATVFSASLMLALWTIEGREEVGFLWGTIAVAVAIFVVGALFRFAQRRAPPLAIDRDRIMVSTGWGNIYISWTDVQCVAFAHFPVGRSPISRGILIYRREMPATRVHVTYLSADEFVALAKIVQRISKFHGFEVVTGFTDSGQRRLQKLPWA